MTPDTQVPSPKLLVPGFRRLAVHSRAGHSDSQAQWSDPEKEFVDRLATLLADIIAKINADFGRDMRLFW